MVVHFRPILTPLAHTLGHTRTHHISLLNIGSGFTMNNYWVFKFCASQVLRSHCVLKHNKILCKWKMCSTQKEGIKVGVLSNCLPLQIEPIKSCFTKNEKLLSKQKLVTFTVWGLHAVIKPKKERSHLIQNLQALFGNRIFFKNR